MIFTLGWELIGVTLYVLLLAGVSTLCLKYAPVIKNKAIPCFIISVGLLHPLVVSYYVLMFWGIFFSGLAGWNKLKKLLTDKQKFIKIGKFQSELILISFFIGTFFILRHIVFILIAQDTWYGT